MHVSIDTRAQAFVAHYDDGAEAHRLSWDWARERGAVFDARLVPVSVSPDGEVAFEDRFAGGVPTELRCVAAGGTFDAERPGRGWTRSERWKMLAWSPLTASEVDGECVWTREDGVEVDRGRLFARPVVAAAAALGLTLVPVS